MRRSSPRPAVVEKIASFPPEDGRYDPSAGVTQRLAGPLRAIGVALEKLQRRNARWVEWIHEAPLVPEVEGQIYLSPMDKAIEQKLGHLAEVCFRPRASLRLDEERVMVAQARRVPPRAFAQLATHPEDWERRTLRSVVPRRIQALIPEDEFDLYENRIAVRLVDHLRRYLFHRLQRLEDLARLISQARGLQETMQDGTWGARHRASQLIGTLFVNNQNINQVAETCRVLRRFDLALRGVQSTLLYRALPKSPISSTLTSTNILINDQHYREVAALWRSWTRWGREDSSPSQLDADWQHFGRFCTLLVLRSLELFRLGPTQDSSGSIKVGDVLHLTGNLGDFTLKVESTAELSLSASDLPGTRLRVWSGQTEPKREVSGTVATLWLIPGLAEASHGGSSIHRERSPSSSDIYQSALSPSSGFDVMMRLMVSPLELSCVERVMKEIQRWLLSARYVAYPAPVSLPRNFPAKVLDLWSKEDWLKVEEAAAPRDGMIRVKQAGAVNENGSRQKRSHSDPSVVVLNTPRENGKRRNMVVGQLKDHVERLPQRDRESIRQIDPSAIDDEFGRCLAALEWLRLCPVCLEKASPRQFNPRDDTFECACDSCDSQWETRICNGCRGKFPVLRLKGRSAEQAELGQQTGLISKDLLAESVPGLDDHFRCSHCGQ